MGYHLVVLGAAVVVSVSATLQATGEQQASGASAAEAAPQQALLDRYCLTCHNERLQTAGLLLDQANIGEVGHDIELWEKVVGKLRTRTMPPAGRPATGRRRL